MTSQFTVKAYRRFALGSFLILAVSFNSNSKAHGAVYDGGEFSVMKISTHTDLGIEKPEPLPSNFAFEDERYSHAPVGKPFYVIGDDKKCYWGNFAYNKYEKALIVYYKSPISADHCIYQKQADIKPNGFSISAKSGGICVPSYGVATEGKQSWEVKESGSPVAFSECVEKTVSYGDNFTKSDSRSVASVADKIEKTVSAHEAVVEHGKSNEPTVRDLAVKTSQVGFPSLDNEVKSWDKDQVNVVAHNEKKGIVSRNDGMTHVSMNEKSKDWTIQISAATSRQEADKTVAKLHNSGIEVFVVEAQVEGKTYYRVCHGHFETRKEARLEQHNVAEKTGEPHAFVQKVTSRIPAGH